MKYVQFASRLACYHKIQLILAWEYIPLALDRCSQIVRKVTKGWQRKSCRSAETEHCNRCQPFPLYNGIYKTGCAQAGQADV